MSNHHQTSRRSFIKSTAGAAAAVSVPYFFSSNLLQAQNDKKNRPTLGCIGTGSRWGAVGKNAMQLSDCLAICDVDEHHLDKGREQVKNLQGREVETYKDYHKILDRKDIDVVTIVTPDHWHSKIAIEAMQAGKDVYCEKPLTLTIEEGKLIRQALKETGRVFQVGTQQRSEMGLRFLNAVALIRDGRIGEVKKVTCVIGGAPTCDELPVIQPPSHLDWNLWLGQAPLEAYRQKGRNSRCHYEFRWWYEYSGGKMTDWGAHHVDIAQWGIDQLGEGQGPTKIEPLMAKHPVEFKNGKPTDDSRYNCATHFKIKCSFANGVEMLIRENAPELKFGNGIIFEGTKGEFRVTRGSLTGEAVDALKDKPLPEDALTKLYKGKTPGGGNAHMRNFFDCLETREQPISDVNTHHRAMTTCHLANIAIRLDRTLNWDPQAEQIVGDDDANAWQSRKQRKGFEVTV